MESIKISIIVPYFNPPIDRFEACVNSITSQHYSNLELILVDDGSMPEYEEVIDRLCMQDKIEIVRLKEKNNGVSIARNLGTIYATGDYVMYVDADDEIPPGVISSAVDVLVKYNLDIVIGYVKYITNEQEKSRNSSIASRRITFPDVRCLSAYHLTGKGRNLNTVLRCGSVLKNGPVARLVRREIAISTKFPEGVPLSEDTLWNVLIFDKARSVGIVEETWYWYWVSHESASRGFNANAVQDAMSFRSAFESVIQGLSNKPSAGSSCSRLLGEVNRAIRTFYAHPECPLSLTESLSGIRQLTKEMDVNHTVRLGNAIDEGIDTAIKYILCRSGLSLLYWTLRLKKRGK